MAKFSKKMMGKEVGDASVYAKPHTMNGKPLKATKKTDPNTLSAKQVNPRTTAMRVSAGDPGADDVKTSGIKIRGTGAATKGLMARGPMA
jgi:hypothetical protein